MLECDSDRDKDEKPVDRHSKFPADDMCAALMELMDFGVLEYWALNASLHYSTIPVLLFVTLKHCACAHSSQQAAEDQ